MSRHGYTDDFGHCDNWGLIRWRGAVKSAIRGKRGQAFLRELRDALDAMQDKRLIRSKLMDEEGSVCAIGALGRHRQIDMSQIDVEEPEQVARAFGISVALVRELEFENDDYHPFRPKSGNAEGDRWQYIRRWVDRQIIKQT